MLRILNLFIFLLLNLIAYSQSDQFITIKQGVPNLTTGSRWEIKKHIVNGTDTSVYFAFVYQNTKYQYVVDQSITIIQSRKELQNFCNKIIDFSEKEFEGTYVETVSGIEFSIVKNYLYLKDKDDKHTFLKKNKASEMGWEILEYINLLDN
jgi:hypothetical protein